MMQSSSITLASALLVACALNPVANAAGYVSDPAASRLEFVGVQAGAEFKGSFHKFSAAVDLSPDAPASANFDVTIYLDSVDTMDKDRDKTMRGPDIFDVAHFATAHYVAHGATKTASGYTAAGSLTLRGVTKNVPITFQFAGTTGLAKMEGTATLNRLDFGVGQGDWKSTEWIADAVKVSFSLVLKPGAHP